MRRILMILPLFFIIGCMTPWSQVGGPYHDTQYGYAVDLPLGWSKLNTDKYLFITRDGGMLQNIFIERMGTDVVFSHTKKKLNKSMLPMEVAEVIIDNISSDKTVLNFQVLENNPLILGADHGFKILFTYNNADDLKFKSIYCGFLTDEWFYTIRYTAPERHYFRKDIDEFERVLGSFKRTS
ncbi:MAG: hypothetical protein HKP58_18870 [Desulfatitalea sp.]|nr:hypothetical protein [Desulfatitalea sp.]NNK02479.1 hypothetical protein [Desulfatitalea sp.]